MLAGLEQADPRNLTETWLTRHLWQARSEVYRNGVLQLYMTHVHDFVKRKGQINVNDDFEMAEMWFTGHRKDQGPREAADGMRFTIRLSMPAPVDYDLRIRVWVEGPAGAVYSKEFHAQNFAGQRTSAWSPGEIHEVRTGLWIPADAPPGTYQTFMGFVGSEGEGLPVSGEFALRTYVGQKGIWLGRTVFVPPSLGPPGGAESS